MTFTPPGLEAGPEVGVRWSRLIFAASAEPTPAHRSSPTPHAAAMAALIGGLVDGLIIFTGILLS
jgi:hypothetical protein